MGIDPLISHFTGSANEHIAAAWYLQRGLQVYWPSVQQDTCDFVIKFGVKFFSVQVKTAWWSGTGSHKYLQCRITPKHKKSGSINPASLYDILFVVGDGELWQIPAEDVTTSNITLRSTNPKYKEAVWERYRVTAYSALSSTAVGATLSPPAQTSHVSTPLSSGWPRACN